MSSANSFFASQKQSSFATQQPSSTTRNSLHTRSLQVEKIRAPRHAGLFEAIQRLDTQMDQQARRELLDWVQAEYEQNFGRVPIGMVAACYLGAPFVDHMLDLTGNILEHYAAAQSMPAPFAKARSLARHKAFAFIEVYSDGSLMPVSHNGAVNS